MASSAENTFFRFLDMPLELRSNVYEHLLDARLGRTQDEGGYVKYKFDLALFRVSRQVHRESLRTFKQINVFVKVETPWEESDVLVEGNVPVLARLAAADNFYPCHLRVIIAQPTGTCLKAKSFIILANDLPLYAQTWAYTDLSYSGQMNPRICLTLDLQHPLGTEEDDCKLQIPIAVQEKLILPFGKVKNLGRMRITGQYSASIEKIMTDAQKVPYDSPELCLEEATKLKDEGNKALKDDPRRALQLYVQAFEKILIVCIGRRRSVWGDHWFDVQLRLGPFKGQFGQIVRMVLRVRLVANTVKAYLDLKEYDEAYFWGMRTIRIMRESVGDDDIPLLNFPASSEFGKIYYRTGVAAKHLGDEAEARSLLRVASQYLPTDLVIRSELASVALKLA